MKPMKKTSKKPPIKVTAVVHVTDSTRPYGRTEESLHLFDAPEKAHGFVKRKMLEILHEAISNEVFEKEIKTLLQKNKIPEAIERFDELKCIETEETFEIYKALPIL